MTMALKTLISTCWMRPSFTSLALGSAPTRSLFFTNKKGLSREYLIKVQQKIDLSPAAIRRQMQRRKWQKLKALHDVDLDKRAELGADMAGAHFIVQRGGAVKFQGYDQWLEPDKDGNCHLPEHGILGMRLEAVDASGMHIMYHSFDSLEKLEIKYLNLSMCPLIDDWCLDRISHDFRDSLKVLDLSQCPHVTEKGLAALHRLKKLEMLRLWNMCKVQHAPLVVMMLEEAMPTCVVEGIDISSVEALQQAKPQDPDLMGHIRHMEEHVLTARNKPGIFNILS